MVVHRHDERVGTARRGARRSIDRGRRRAEGMMMTRSGSHRACSGRRRRSAPAPGRISGNHAATIGGRDRERDDRDERRGRCPVGVPVGFHLARERRGGRRPDGRRAQRGGGAMREREAEDGALASASAVAGDSHPRVTGHPRGRPRESTSAVAPSADAERTRQRGGACSAPPHARATPQSPSSRARGVAHVRGRARATGDTRRDSARMRTEAGPLTRLRFCTPRASRRRSTRRRSTRPRRWRCS